MAVDPFSLAIAGGGLVSSLLGGQAQKRAAEKARQDALRMFAEEMRFAKAGRTDAYGNRINFSDALNEWLTTLTPQQQRLMRASEREQLLGLTEDAARNRNVRRRQDRIGSQSAEDFNTQRAEFNYGPRKSEAVIQDEIAKLIARQRSTPNVGASRQQVRMGAPIVNTGRSGANQNQAVSDALLARKAALDEFNTREQGRISRFLPTLQTFAQGSGQGGGTPVTGYGETGRLSQTQDAMAQLALNIASKGNDRIAGANKDLTVAAGKQFPSLTDSARLIAALRGQPINSRTGSGKPVAKTGQDATFSFWD